jgi:hypothetical protein
LLVSINDIKKQEEALELIQDDALEHVEGLAQKLQHR